jgi:hypothetical protein
MSPSDASTEPAERARSPFGFSRAELALMVLVLVFYATTRVVAIADFPIFFFCDEATHANLAEDLVANGLRDQEGNFFPPYFRNAKTYNLSLSVWILAPFLVVFGKSIAVVRLTTGLIGLLGAAALMLALKIGYENRLWWTGGLVFAALPGWFLHSRTAFETVMMVGFYAGFMLAYLLYREISPRWLPLVVILGGATFYSYSNGQGVMFVSVILLLATDWRYHFEVIRRHPWIVVGGLVTAVMVASPYVRFRFLLHPEMVQEHFSDLHSYWLDDIPVTDKVSIFLRTYGEGLSPLYWFFDDTEELVRHRMLGYGSLPLWLAPAILLGVWVSLRRCLDSAPHRLVLIAVLAAPFSSAMVDIRITRVLAMMAPATILAVIGLDCLRHWLRRWVPTGVFAAMVAAGLVAASTAMTVDALRNGATWFDNYGMFGTQWGARQLYGELERQLEEDPKIEFVVSHSWANFPNAFNRFFLEPELRKRVRLGVIDELIFEYRPNSISPHHRYVVTPEEYRRAVEHAMIDVSEPLWIIPYPDGRPGFYFVTVAYSANARESFEEERRKRREPVESSIVYRGSDVVVSHPKFDVGTIEELFDGDFDTIARTLDADPSTLVFSFTEPQPISGIRIGLWTPSFDLTLRAQTDAGAETEATEKIRTHESFGVHELMLPAPVAEARTVTVVIDKHGDTKAHIQELVFLR